MIRVVMTQSSILETPPSLILYGQPGSGKSTELAKAFPNCVWVVTSREVLRPYASWLEQNPEQAKEQGLAMIPDTRIIELQDFSLNEKGEMTKIDVESRIKAILQQLAVRIKTNPDFNIEGLIFDEWSIFAASITEDIKKRGKKGWDVWSELIEFHRQLCAWPKLTNKVLGLVCHESGPRYFEEGPKAGQLQYRGGPSLPSGKVISQVCATASIVLQIEITADPYQPQQPAKRMYRTEVSPLWERKFRDFRINPEEALGLRAMLQRAGYVVNAANK